MNYDLPIALGRFRLPTKVEGDVINENYSMRRGIMRSLSCKCYSWAQICVIVFLVSYAAIAQPSPPPGSTGDGQATQSALLGHLRFLQEAEKSHREFLEKLYINTLYALGVLGSAVGLIFAFFHYKSYKDIEKAVEAKFNKSVEAKVDNALDDFKKELERKKEDVEKDLERVKEDVRARLGDLSDVVQRQGGVEDTEAVAAPDLDQQELKILKLTGSGRYSFRSLAGIANDSGQSQADVAAQLERLSKKGVVGKTLGKSGAERWFVTTEGRKYLMAGSPTAWQIVPRPHRSTPRFFGALLDA